MGLARRIIAELNTRGSFASYKSYFTEAQSVEELKQTHAENYLEFQ